MCMFGLVVAYYNHLSTVAKRSSLGKKCGLIFSTGVTSDVYNVVKDCAGLIK